MRRLNASFAALALVLSLGLAACGDDDIDVASECVQDTPSGQLPTGGPVGCEDSERSDDCIPRGNASPSGETDNAGDAGDSGTTGDGGGATGDDGAVTGDGEQGISGSAPGCEETDERGGESRQTNLNTGNDGAVRGGSGQTTPDGGGAAGTCSGETEGVGECSGETTGEDAPEGQDHPETGSFRD